jgi:hypothetical protein
MGSRRLHVRVNISSYRVFDLALVTGGSLTVLGIKTHSYFACHEIWNRTQNIGSTVMIFIKAAVLTSALSAGLARATFALEDSSPPDYELAPQGTRILPRLEKQKLVYSFGIDGSLMAIQSY